ncbi:MAG TPA: hypothetical protein VLU99_04585 [Nitrososphaerales archaeon]|nr:hypothetical protein [Nitrososphaerales archaeon]HUK75048.1 hypothetical protein [Nitrososphaerales archaeon]
MSSKGKAAGRDKAFPDASLEASWSPARRRFAEQVRLLMRALRSTDEAVRDLAVVQITLLGTKAVPSLISALESALDESDLKQVSRESPSSSEREIEGICDALGIIGDADSVVDLAAALPRKEAVEALARIGGERSLELIMGTLEDEQSGGGPLGTYGAEADPEFVRRVFLLLGEAGKKRLKQDLADRSGRAREAIAQIARIMGYSDILP